MYEFPVKTFFWALSGEFIFREMPDLTEQHDAMLDSDTSYFQGTPSAVLSGKKEGDEEEQEEAKEEKEESDPEGKENKGKNSDETSEEEVKVPTRPLTGKCCFIPPTLSYQVNSSIHQHLEFVSNMCFFDFYRAR